MSGPTSPCAHHRSASVRLSAAVELSAYRIVQESLTNIIKHAGPDPTAHVTIGIDEAGLVIDITNSTATTGAARLPASGYGIAGMRERATLLGGTLSAAPEPPDRFRVNARIPRQRVEKRSEPPHRGDPIRPRRRIQHGYPPARRSAGPQREGSARRRDHNHRFAAEADRHSGCRDLRGGRW
jgi:hypothetical protein